jgi:hypothetical protein
MMSVNLKRVNAVQNSFNKILVRESAIGHQVDPVGKYSAAIFLQESRLNLLFSQFWIYFIG